MIYIAIIIFMAPLLLRIIRTKAYSIHVLSPTIIIYGVWFLLSYLLILLSVNLHFYLYFFCLFPISFLCYEIYKTYFQIKQITFNKYHVFILIFIVSNLLIILFTHRYLPDDSNYYAKWSIDTIKQNSYIKDYLYRFNSFYYLSTIFGNYNIMFFYTVFIPWIFGIFLYIIILQITKFKFEKLLNIPTQIFISIIISIYCCSAWSLKSNIIVISFISLMYVLLLINLNKSSKYNTLNFLMFDFAILFTMNFSLSGFVSIMLLLIAIKIYILWKFKDVFQLLFLPVFIFFIINYSNNIYLDNINIILLLIYIFIILVIFTIITKHIYRKNSKFINTQNCIPNIFDVFDVHLNKKQYFFMLLLFNSLIICYVVSALTIAKLSFSINIKIDNVLNVVLLLIFINTLLLKKCYILLYISIIVIITWFFYFLCITAFPAIVPAYLKDRTRYIFYVWTIIFMLLILWDTAYNLKKSSYLIAKKISLLLFPEILMVNVVNPTVINMLNVELNPHFKNLISKNNFNLIYKNFNYIFDAGPDGVFSTIWIPFNTMHNAHYYYYNSLLYKPNVNPKGFYLEWGTNFKEKIKIKIQHMYDLLLLGTKPHSQPQHYIPYYNVIILQKSSKLNKIKNITKNYKIIDSNQEIGIWLKIKK